MDKCLNNLGIEIYEDVIFARSRPGVYGVDTFSKDESHTLFNDKDIEHSLGSSLRTNDDLLLLPEISEPDAVRHYTRLSKKNFSIDTSSYPLGSCTMKYNPKLHEWAARLPGILDLHPYLPECELQQ